MSAKCETDQVDRLKAALESLRDFVHECSLRFNPAGMEIIGHDRANVIAISYVLPASRFKETGGSYECPSTVEVGIKTKLMATCLKCSTIGDVVSLGIEPDTPGRIVVICRNVSKVSRWEIVTPILSDDEERITSQGLEFSGSITLPTNLFHEMVRDLTTADVDTVRLYCDGARLLMIADGPMTKMTFELHSGDHRGNTKFEEGKDIAAGRAKWPVDELYPLIFLQKIAKAKNICNRITIHLRPNFPAAFVYDSSIGILTYLVAPRVDADIPKTQCPAPMTPLTAAAAPRSSKKRGETTTGEPEKKRARRSQRSSSASESDDDKSDRSD
jgi:proliferating cell nuclear antigen PCNA